MIDGITSKKKIKFKSTWKKDKINNKLQLNNIFINKISEKQKDIEENLFIIKWLTGKLETKKKLIKLVKTEIISIIF